MLKSLDILGDKISFLNDGSKIQKTNFGGFFTCVSSIILALLIYGFGQDFFKRLNPAVIKATQNPDEYPFWNVTNSNFTFAFRVEDFEGNKWENTTMFYLEGYYYYLEMKEGEWEEIANIPLDIVQCTLEMFPPGISFVNNYNLSELYCPVLNNFYFGGYWEYNKIGYMMINLMYCREGLTNNKGENCSSELDIIDTLKNQRVMSFYYNKIVVDPKNYRYPIKKEIENTYYQLDNIVTKSAYYFSIIIQLLQTSDGLLPLNTMNLLSE